MKVAVYCRVSTDEQRDKQSIETQVDFARRYAALHELDIVQWYKDDGVSGGIPCGKRPAGAQMLTDARAGQFAVLLVYRVTRLSRGLRDLLNTIDLLEVAGVAFCSMTENIDTTTPAGRLTLQMLGSLGEFEKESNREHSIEGSRKRARDGQWLGVWPHLDIPRTSTGSLSSLKRPH